jgi:hypothetical protein
MSTVLKVFCGFDQREAAGWHAFAQSVIERCSRPVSLIPMKLDLQRDGSNAFTYSRFLVPYLCDFNGWALWLDGADMIAVDDLENLFEHRDGWHAAHVVKHDYRTKHGRKYVGTEMESDNRDYPRKNWSSVILWDCGHYMNRCLTPKYVTEQEGAFLHRFAWLPDDRIGELPPEWNWLTDEFGANTAARLLHFTAGIPAIDAYKRSPHAQMWHLQHARSNDDAGRRRIAELASAR